MAYADNQEARVRYARFAGYFLIVFISSRPSFGCSCIGGVPTCNTYWSTDTVFLGRVTKIQGIPGTGAGPSAEWPATLVDFQITEHFRGASGTSITIRTGRGGGDCGYTFEPGKTYLVFASGSPLTTGICNPTMPVERADETLAYIRKAPLEPSGGNLYGTVFLRPKRGEPGKLSHMPMSGVKVTARGPEVLTVITDSAGRYTFPRAPAGSYSVELDLPENYVNSPVKVTLPDRGCAQRDFYTQSDGRIRGRVTDRNGTGISNLDVQAIPWESRNLRQGQLSGVAANATTDKDGNYEIAQLFPGSYMVVAGQFPQIDHSRPHYTAEYYPGGKSRTEAAPLSLGDGQWRTSVDFNLRGPLPNKQLAVQVVWPDGSPAEGAQILFAPLEMGYLFTETPASDREGAAQIQLEGGTSYIVCARLDRPRPARSTAIAVDSSTSEIPLRLILDSPGNGECPGYRELALGQ
jgi:hypothetical protein